MFFEKSHIAINNDKFINKTSWLNFLSEDLFSLRQVIYKITFSDILKLAFIKRAFLTKKKCYFLNSAPPAKQFSEKLSTLIDKFVLFKTGVVTPRAGLLQSSTIKSKT